MIDCEYLPIISPTSARHLIGRLIPTTAALARSKGVCLERPEDLRNAERLAAKTSRSWNHSIKRPVCSVWTKADYFRTLWQVKLNRQRKNILCHCLTQRGLVAVKPESIIRRLRRLHRS